jgi:hypothetical protein
MTKATPTIADARELGTRYGLEGVVIMHHDGMQAGYVSWGHTKAECGWMRRFADKAYLAFMRMWVNDR